MDGWDWTITFVGAAITIAVLVDVFLTVLHIDTDGPMARTVFRGVWKATMVPVRAFPRSRRMLVSLAGPFMIVGVVAAWMGTFILGFALAYWPHLSGFRTAQGLGPAGFVEALYLSGGTATVLGYGDITPVEAVPQLATFLQAGLGFGMMTAIITYLVNVVSGVSERNAVALRLRLATGGRGGEGAVALVRALARERSGDLRLRLQTLLPEMQGLHQRMHQFPIVDLYYRSRNPAFAPELMLKAAAEMSIAARLLAEDPRHGHLAHAAEELAETTTEIMRLVAAQHLPASVGAALENPAGDPDDRAFVETVRGALLDALPEVRLGEGEPPESVKLAIRRTRIFLDHVDDLTGWRMDHVEA